jgi:hypothetical protein
VHLDVVEVLALAEVVVVGGGEEARAVRRPERFPRTMASRKPSWMLNDNISHPYIVAGGWLEGARRDREGGVVADETREVGSLTGWMRWKKKSFY